MGAAIPIIISVISAVAQNEQAKSARRESKDAASAEAERQQKIMDAAAAEAAEKKRLIAEERARKEGELRDLEAKRAKRAQSAAEGSTLKTGLQAWQSGKQTLGA